MTTYLSEPTGTIYAEQLTKSPYRALGGFLNVANPEFSTTRTGQEDLETQAKTQSDFVEYAPIKHLSHNVTGSELQVHFLPFTFLNVVDHRYVTGYRVKISFERGLQNVINQVSNHEFSINIQRSSSANPARRLREISGLDVRRLAYIFQVTRPAYYKWLVSSVPHITHREHLLEVLSLVERALQRLGNPKNVADWLLTPIIDTGIKPIDYLRTQKYLTFRGILLSIRTGNEVIQPLNTPSLVRNEFPREEMDEEIENLSPRTLLSDEMDSSDTEL